MTKSILFLLLILSAPMAHAADYSKDPVLMVHGYFLPDFATWASIEGKLIDDGWPAEFLFGQTFDSVVGCNPNHGEAIAASVQMIREVTGRDKVDLLAHSMGGLDCRYYIKYLCGYKYVKDVVMLAGANQGSVVACLDPLSCGAEQMCVGGYDGAWTENPFLADLNACDMTPGDDLLYTSVWSEWDEIIMPQENSILPGALNHELDSFAEHATILLNGEAYDWVKTGLYGGGSNTVGSDGPGPCVALCEVPTEPGPEPAWTDVVEASADVVEGIEEVVEEIIEAPPDAAPDDDLEHTPDARAPDGPLLPLEITGDGHITDLDGSNQDSGPSGPLYSLPPTKSGGCAETPTPIPFNEWALLLLGIAASLRVLRHRSRPRR